MGTDLDLIYRVTKTQATAGFGRRGSFSAHGEKQSVSFIYTGVTTLLAIL